MTRAGVLVLIFGEDRLAWEGIVLLVLVLLLVAAYPVPTAVAVARRVPSTRWVIALNILLGWTLVGWAIAFARAVREPGGVVEQDAARGATGNETGEELGHDRTAAASLIELAGAPRAEPRPASYYAGWRADPLGRHELRYFDGAVWTEQVSDGGRSRPTRSDIAHEHPLQRAVGR